MLALANYGRAIRVLIYVSCLRILSLSIFSVTKSFPKPRQFLDVAMHVGMLALAKFWLSYKDSNLIDVSFPITIITMNILCN